MPGYRRFRLLAVLLIGLGTNLATAAEWDASALMQIMVEHKAARATFVETTYLAILDRPVTASGELAFVAPDHLEKLTLKPKREVLVLDGTALSIERNRRKHRLDLADYPQVAAFTDSIRGVLAGDLAALTRSYTLTLSGSAERWSLQLLPKAALDGIDKIIISGSANALNAIEIQQQDGDRSVMQIDNSAPEKMPRGNAP